MKRKIIPYNPKLKELARQLRNNSTKSEILLWKRLKGKQMKDYDFHRQKPLLNYIVDFYCYELNLVIEIDGYSHLLDEIKEKDIKKQKELEGQGLFILRFTDKQIFKEMDNVIREIEGYVVSFEKTHP